MKRLLLIIILTFSFQSWVKANDIRDFEIEGMSIGDSALDYFDVSIIKKYTYDNFYNYKKDSKRFLAVQFNDIVLKQYDYLTLHIKNKDKKYIIYEISGAMSYENEIEKCYTEKNTIIDDLKSLFSDYEEYDSERQYRKNDKESTYDRIDLELKSGDNITVICNDWSKESGFLDHLSIGIESKEFSDWLNNENN